jgi:hypothetical protein
MGQSCLALNMKHDMGCRWRTPFPDEAFRSIALTAFGKEVILKICTRP